MAPSYHTVNSCRAPMGVAQSIILKFKRREKENGMVLGLLLLLVVVGKQGQRCGVEHS